jgi:hypothetical protein
VIPSVRPIRPNGRWRVDQGERIVGGTIERLAGMRELERAIDPVEQRLAELFLERAHGVADGRLRDMQIARGARKAHLCRGGAKGSQLIERESWRTIHVRSSCQHGEIIA